MFHPHPGLAVPSPYPPVGFRMCQVCGLDFSVRRCTGEGCVQGGGEGGGGGGGGGGAEAEARGSNYCYKCFVLYHPRADPQWAAHWTDVRDLPAGGGGGGSLPLAVVPAPEDPTALQEEHVEAIRAARPLGERQGGGAGGGSGSGSAKVEQQQGAGPGFTIPALSLQAQ